MRIRIAVLLTVLGIVSMPPAARAQSSRSSIEYDDDLTPPAVFKARRDTVMARIGNEAVAVFYAAPVRNRNNDVEYRYRQNDDFFYLTGFTEPNAILVLSPRGVRVPDMADTTHIITVHEILFVQRRDPGRERWTGRRYGPQCAMTLRGLEYAETNGAFSGMLRSILGGAAYLYVPSIPNDLTGEIRTLMSPLLDLIDQYGSFVEVRDPRPTIRSMRTIKDADEIRLLRKATQISAIAHREAMRSVEPGMREYQVQAVYEYVFISMGSEYPGYPSIVGAGENTCILHYDTDRKQIRDGELVLADCAAEYHGYSSDVTRTYPANGRFTKAQRDVYAVVLAAQKAAIGAMRPGVAWRDVSARADSVLERGLLRLGLISSANGKEFRRFVWHGLGHAVGLDVHDAEVGMLRPGVAYTVEPGIYIPAGMEGVDPTFDAIGVRIEDVVLITDDGNEVLSTDAPKDPDEIERVMKDRGLGNTPIR